MTDKSAHESELIVTFPELESAGERDTSKIAAALGKEVYGGLTIILTGCLGAGKTTFVRYLAESLGVCGVKSPTFATESVHRIPGRDFDLVHADLYKFDYVAPGSDTGLQFEEYLSSPHGPLLVVEWGDRWTPPAGGVWSVGISTPEPDAGRRMFALSAAGLEAFEYMARAYESILATC